MEREREGDIFQDGLRWLNFYNAMNEKVVVKSIPEDVHTGPCLGDPVTPRRSQ